MSRNSPAADQHIEARQERLADLIVDDESLIGDFPEEASDVLVNWAISVTDRLAASTASLDKKAAEPVLDDATGALKTLLRAVTEILNLHHDGQSAARDKELGALAKLAADERLRHLFVERGQQFRTDLADRLKPATLVRGRLDTAQLADRLIRAIDPGNGARP